MFEVAHDVPAVLCPVINQPNFSETDVYLMVSAPHPFKTIFFRKQVNVGLNPTSTIFVHKKSSPTKKFLTEQPPHPRALEKKTNKKVRPPQRTHQTLPPHPSLSLTFVDSLMRMESK